MKYKLTNQTIIVNGRTLYRIKSLKKFSNVKKGDLGGYIEKVENLSQESNCWVYGNALVYGNARVYGNANVYGNAQVYQNARIYENAHVYENARIYGIAHVYGNARIYGIAHVYGNALVYGNCRVDGSALVHGNAHVYGNGRVYEGDITENINGENINSEIKSEIKVIKKQAKEVEIIRPNIINAIKWLDVCTE